LGLVCDASCGRVQTVLIHRVLGDLEKEGRVKKQGRQYYPGG